MNSSSFNTPPDCGETMSAVYAFVGSLDCLSEATKRDYQAQISRCVLIYNANDLADIPAILAAFLVRFGKKEYPVDHFNSRKSYMAWRKKMLSILKRFLGISKEAEERRARSDDWAIIREEWINIRSEKHKGIIAISLLMDEARKSGLGPSDLSRDWLIGLMDDLNTMRRPGISRAIRLLEEVRVESEVIDKLLGKDPLPDPTILRRAPIVELPANLDQQLISLVETRCCGEIDEISNEFVDGKAKATFEGYRAAGRKYTSTALSIGALSTDCEDIANAFDRSVFLAVMRHWNSEERREYRIADRSKRSYVIRIIALAESLGRDASFMRKALDTNPNLKNGRAEANSMPLETRNFCARLLRSRNSELIFKSMHIRFQERAIALMTSTTPVPFSDWRIIQLGMLATFSAIALWGVPLRIGNMHSLRHKGENPTLVLPRGARQRAHLLIPAQDVKNRKPIKAHISEGPTRALEILEWYLEEIRPRVPYADRSDYLFPGYKNPLLGVTTLREWLQEHSRNLGIPMDPHNFRHGLATLYLRDHPGDYSAAARLLCNTPKTVRAHYAWIDEEAEMRKVQEAVARMGGFRRGF